MTFLALTVAVLLAAAFWVAIRLDPRRREVPPRTAADVRHTRQLAQDAFHPLTPTDRRRVRRAVRRGTPEPEPALADATRRWATARVVRAERHLGAAWHHVAPVIALLSAQRVAMAVQELTGAEALWRILAAAVVAIYPLAVAYELEARSLLRARSCLTRSTAPHAPPVPSA